MASFETVAGLLAGAAGLFLPTFAWARWRRKRRLGQTAAPAAGGRAPARAR